MTRALSLLLSAGLLVLSSGAAKAETMSKDLQAITDFSASSPNLGWFVVNDNVMGGRSVGGFQVVDDQLVFSGTTNTNGGGFSSIRTAPLHLELSSYAGIQLQLDGDGRRYTWRLTTDAQWRGRPVAYWADFATNENETINVDLPFSRFEPRFRGQSLEGPHIDASKITSMGLMIYDGLDGPFELRLYSVQAQ